eukprot:g34320.t1
MLSFLERFLKLKASDRAERIFAVLSALYFLHKLWRRMQQPALEEAKKESESAKAEKLKNVAEKSKALEFLSLQDLDVRDKRVLVRADLNVPMDKKGKITETSRIDCTIPTIRNVLQRGGRVILASHHGRPEGKVVEKESLKFIVPYLQSVLPGVKVEFCEDCIGPAAEQAVANLGKGEVLLLENLRFYAEEEKDGAKFAAKLAKLADCMVNDAFACSHRAHSSVHEITRLLPSAAGMLMEKELWSLGRALEDPKKPVAAITGGAKVSTKLLLLRAGQKCLPSCCYYGRGKSVYQAAAITGGAKVSTKLSILINLAKKVDYILVGGGIANTILYAQGKEVGISLCEKDMVKDVKKFLAAAKEARCQVVVPVDMLVSKEFKAGKGQAASVDAIPKDMMALDIGPKSIEQFSAVIRNCKTVIWNGPLGAFELEGYGEGTRAVANLVADLTAEGKVLSVTGGGDSIAALSQLVPGKEFSYVSTAGGAFLEWMEGRVLPGVAALHDVYGRTATMAVLKAKDIMTPKPQALSPENTIAEAGVLMQKSGFRHVPVVEGEVFAGLFTQRDFLQVSDQKQKLRTVMRAAKDVAVVGPDLPVKTIAAMLIEDKRGSCVPVVGNGQVLVGIITEHDFVKCLHLLLSSAEEVQRTVFKSLAHR